MGGTIYTTSFPCQLCMRKIIQAGILRIVYHHNYASTLSFEMLQMTDIELVHLDPDTGVPTLNKKRSVNEREDIADYFST